MKLFIPFSSFEFREVFFMNILFSWSSFPLGGLVVSISSESGDEGIKSFVPDLEDVKSDIKGEPKGKLKKIPDHWWDWGN